MKKIISLSALILVLTVWVGCSHKEKFHSKTMPDPASYNAHFPELDSNGDDIVDWAEFQNHFPDANPDIYKALDLNGDGNVDHDEWHEFKTAHDLKHIKKE